MCARHVEGRPIVFKNSKGVHMLRRRGLLDNRHNNLRGLEEVYKWMVDEEKKIEERVMEGEKPFLRKALNRASISIKRSMLGEVISALKWNREWTQNQRKMKQSGKKCKQKPARNIEG